MRLDNIILLIVRIGQHDATQFHMQRTGGTHVRNTQPTQCQYVPSNAAFCCKGSHKIAVNGGAQHRSYTAYRHAFGCSNASLESGRLQRRHRDGWAGDHRLRRCLHERNGESMPRVGERVGHADLSENTKAIRSSTHAKSIERNLVCR